ncbi:FAD-binding protein [Nostocoides sp. F2B08]|uniref:FAD-binding oxidoreductase n=1 Tax=Nostocoides sp. F2B08 TaxID=2653936 RepID=UPI001263A765|nr:FAD-linked oxidase C-terminal domain-containing protein [Tetrasphaera sp. F2B08]KAB7743867.1 FAD-binding protein [Tetrasphaera sp. F2B08]
MVEVAVDAAAGHGPGRLALADLAASVGAGDLLTDPAAMEAYRRDWAKDPDVGMPCAVLRARSPEQVVEAMRWATRTRTPVVPRGAGSGLSGGSSAVAGALTISLDRMRAVEVDVATRTARVEPGALNVEVKRAAAGHGLWYPPDPSSFEICSIGGNLATNAGGLCCVKYGVTTDYVLGLDVVLADGRLLRLGGPRVKDVAGLSLLKLFVGSEGTLGVITGATLRLVPAPPPAATLVASFASVADAAHSVVVIGASLRASMMELMDNAAINAVEDLRPMGLDRSAGALLIAQSDAPGEARASEVEAMARVCERHDAIELFTTDDPEEGELFCAARRAFFPAMERRGSLLLEDVGVPVPVLPGLLEGIARIAARLEVDIPVVAHAGDGNTHPIIVYDASDQVATDHARLAFGEVMALAISLGGTITGEHGVGRLKKTALPAQLGEDVMDVSRAIKAALDPLGLLNPGAVL